MTPIEEEFFRKANSKWRPGTAPTTPWSSGEPIPKPAPLPKEQTGNKRCPYCGEKILAVAILCKHCKSRLDEQTGREAQSQSTPVCVNHAGNVAVIRCEDCDAPICELCRFDSVCP